MTGTTQIDELGTLETPIALTNTLAVGPAMQGLVELVLKITRKMDPALTINAVVGETNDGFLSDIHRIVITPEDVIMAYDNRTRDFALGSVGAGTGTCAFSWKGGIGSASRILRIARKSYAVGALLQTNFGGALTILGVPVGTLLGKTSFGAFLASAQLRFLHDDSGDRRAAILQAIGPTGSPGHVGARANRSILGHGSGDYALAFSTCRSGIEGVRQETGLTDRELNPFFLAAVEAVEESVYDSLFASETLAGRDGHRLEQIPVSKVVKMLRRYLPKSLPG
jgi:D-aminopeptidase